MDRKECSCGEASQELPQFDVPKEKIVAILAAAAFAILATFVLYALNFPAGFTREQETWGQFGDYFGGVLNPILAFLSFGALLYALVLQSKELRAAASHVAKTAKALDEQHKVLSLQNFENTYFRLLNRSSEIVLNMSYSARGQGHVLWGRAALEAHYNSLKRDLKKVQATPSSVRKGYEHYLKERSNELGHYFRMLYHLFTFVDKAALLRDEKIRYANLASAQLSDTELCFLFYIGITGEGETGFKPLIEEYGLLKHLRSHLLADPKHHREFGFYSENAFGSAAERASDEPHVGRVSDVPSEA